MGSVRCQGEARGPREGECQARAAWTVPRPRPSGGFTAGPVTRFSQRTRIPSWLVNVFLQVCNFNFCFLFYLPYHLTEALGSLAGLLQKLPNLVSLSPLGSHTLKRSRASRRSAHGVCCVVSAVRRTVCPLDEQRLSAPAVTLAPCPEPQSPAPAQHPCLRVPLDVLFLCLASRASGSFKATGCAVSFPGV